MDDYSTTASQLADRLLGIKPEKAIFTFDELMSRPRQPRSLLLAPYLPKTGIAVLAGTPDCGKSLFARQLALAVASGATEFCGLELTANQNRAIYVSTEDSLDDAQSVIERQSQGMRIREASPGLRYYDAAGANPSEIFEGLIKALDDAPADIVIVDGWGDIFGGKDGNSNMEVRRVLHPYHALCTRNECLILFIHHVNKSAYDVRPKQAHLQGAAALAQKARVVLMMRKEEDDSRTITAVKGNMIADDKKKQAYRLKLDPDHLLFRAIGFEAVREDSPSEYGEIDWDLIFGPYATLRTAQLIDRLKEEYGMSRATTERRIREDLQPLSHGVWGRRAEIDYLDPYDPD